MTNEDKTLNRKTYFVVGLFLIIILLSMYIVINKAIIKTKEINNNKQLELENKTILDGSSIVTELSLENDKIKQLYNYINHNDIEYELYKNKDNFSWDIKSLIVSINLDKKILIDNETNFISIDEFENLYNKIFGNINEVNISDRISNICNGVSINKELNRYEINNNCTYDNSLNIKTYLKNITIKDDIISINKYYSFVNYTIKGEDIYYKDVLDDKYLIAENIDIKDESNYINKMKIISYKFKKNKDNNYNLYKVEIGGSYE